MEVISYIKILNNSELGKTNTNETYIRIGIYKNEINNFFENAIQREVIDLNDGTIYTTIRLTVGREYRIPGLGSFYRKYDLKAGDGVILQKYIKFDLNGNKEVKFYIDYVKNNVLVFDKIQENYEISNYDKKIKKVNSTKKKLLKHKSNFYITKVFFNGKIVTLRIVYLKRKAKRAESSYGIKLYNVFINGEKSILKRMVLDKLGILSELKSKEKYYKIKY